MGNAEKIDIEVFKAVTRAIAQSDDLEVMTGHLAQLLVGTLEIKGCSIFAFEPQSRELERLSSFGLSSGYLNKGPVFSDKSIGDIKKGKPVIIRDLNDTDLLQYPQEAKEEGIGAIVSLPIKFYGKNIGALRLYHHEQWEISQKDVDSLLVLAENIGLAMTYTRVLNALKEVKDTVNDVHSIWFNAVGG
jgi:transcriptional regulator with GAF, ATPase, and Fis domain